MPGRKCRNSCRLRVCFLNPSRVVLERLAKERGYEQSMKSGEKRLELGRVIDDLVGMLPKEALPEIPEYLRLAKEARLVPG